MSNNKNNPDGSRVSIGVLVDADLYSRFDALVQDKCLQKTRVLRKLIQDFVDTGHFASEKD